MRAAEEAVGIIGVHVAQAVRPGHFKAVDTDKVICGVLIGQRVARHPLGADRAVHNGGGGVVVKGVGVVSYGQKVQVVYSGGMLVGFLAGACAVRIVGVGVHLPKVQVVGGVEPQSKGQAGHRAGNIARLYRPYLHGAALGKQFFRQHRAAFGIIGLPGDSAIERVFQHRLRGSAGKLYLGIGGNRAPIGCGPHRLYLGLGIIVVGFYRGGKAVFFRPHPDSLGERVQNRFVLRVINLHGFTAVSRVIDLGALCGGGKGKRVALGHGALGIRLHPAADLRAFHGTAG